MAWRNHVEYYVTIEPFTSTRLLWRICTRLGEAVLNTLSLLNHSLAHGFGELREAVLNISLLLQVCKSASLVWGWGVVSFFTWFVGIAMAEICSSFPVCPLWIWQSYSKLDLVVFVWIHSYNSKLSLIWMAYYWGEDELDFFFDP